MISIRAEDQHKFAAYLQGRIGGPWRVTLSNGLGASFTYAGLPRDEVGFSIQLSACRTASDVLALCRAEGCRTYDYSLAGDTPAMDGSQVMDRLDMEEPERVSPASRWHFMPDDDDAPDLFFATEAEACAAQQGYRIARGFHPITGYRQS